MDLISETDVCLRCREKEWAFDAAEVLFLYRGPLKKLLSAYKFGERRSLAPFFAALLAERIHANWPDRVVVPVPPRPGKLRELGWDQVETIVRVLQRRGMPVSRILQRNGAGQQKRLARLDRQVNARRAYSCRPDAIVPPNILLFDDVITTGSTAQACAAALRDAGAQSVALLVLAAD